MEHEGNITGEFKHLENRMDKFEKQLNEVGKGVNDIKNAMVGNEIYPGGMKIALEIAQRDIIRLQVDIATLRELRNSDKQYVIGISVGIAAAVSIVWTIITFVFK